MQKVHRNYNLLLWKTSILRRKLYTFLNRKWLFDKVYNEIITQNLLDFGYHFTYKFIDRGLIESLGPFGLSNVLLRHRKGLPVRGQRTHTNAKKRPSLRFNVN